MHQLPSNIFMDRPISFRCTKIKVLNIGGTPQYVPLKSTAKNCNIF